MSFGQIVVTVIVVVFFLYEIYALIRDWKKKSQAKKELQKDGNNNENENTKKA